MNNIDLYILYPSFFSPQCHTHSDLVSHYLGVSIEIIGLREIHI